MIMDSEMIALITVATILLVIVLFENGIFKKIKKFFTKLKKSKHHDIDPFDEEDWSEKDTPVEYDWDNEYDDIY